MAENKVIPTLQVADLPSVAVSRMAPTGSPPMLSPHANPGDEWEGDSVTLLDDSQKSYTEPGRVHLLNLLSYLLDYGDQVALITGVAGLGKSYMLKQLQLSPGSHWRLCVVDAASQVDDRQFFLGIAQGLGVSPVTLGDNWQLALREHLGGLARSTMIPVLAVDNAHLLPPARLSLLLQLYHDCMVDGRTTLRLVLFGEKSLAALFAKVQEKGPALLAREFELNPFTREQADEYIRSRLKVSNGLQRELLSEAWLAWAYKQTAGIPGAINEFLEEKSPQLNQAGPGGRARLLWSTMSLLLVLALAGTVWRGYPEWINRTTETLMTVLSSGEDETPALVMEQQGIAEVAVVIDEAQPDSQLPEIPPVDQESLQASAPMEAEHVHEPQATSDATLPAAIPEVVQQEAVVMPTETASPPPELEQQTVEEAVSPPMAEEDAEVALAPPPSDELPQQRNNIKAEGWLLQQDAQTYTLQLLGVHNEAALLKFIRDHTLQDHVAYYHKLRNNQDWYVLVYGVYADGVKAREARSQLTKSLQKLKPFPRQLADIQRDINATP